jgi:uncharacterized protein (DUF1330 family)
MRRGYWVACYRAIANPQALRNYSALAGPAIEAAGGSFLSRGIAVRAHEAGWLERTVIVEFESVEAAKAAYKTDAYRECARCHDGRRFVSRFDAYLFALTRFTSDMRNPYLTRHDCSEE